MKTKELVLKWLCLCFAILTIQTAQSQSYTLNIVTNPPQGGIISGAGSYLAVTTNSCNIQASNGWYVTDIAYSGSLQTIGQYSTPPQQWSHTLTIDQVASILTGIPFDPTTITSYSVTIPPMLSDGTLTVSFASAAPAITTQPTNEIAITGRSVTLTQGANGRQPIAYQWQFNISNIVGATNSSLVFNAVQLTNTGAYTIVVSNIFGVITNSVPSTLNVVDIGVFADGNFLTNKPYTAPNYSYIDLESLYSDGYIFYTLDGSDPDFTGTEYTSPFYIFSSSTVRAIAYNGDFSEFVEADPAVIQILPSYQLSVLNYGGGSVTENSPTEGGQYSYGYYSYGNFLSNTVVTLVATPSSGSTFMGWAGALQGNNPTNTVTINQNTSIQAIFGTALNPTNIGNGMVSIHPAASVYPYGFNVQVSAIPSSGACLVQWRDAATGSQNPLNLTITTANATIAGIFAPLPTNKVSLSVLSDGGGYVAINPSANIYLQGTTNVLTAVANSGQNFISWSGDATNTTNVISVVMDKSKSITAHFSHNFSQNFTKSGANLQFSIRGGVSGDTYQLVTSTNLSTWTPMATNVDFFEPVIFFDSIDKTVPYRFYKTVVQ